MQNITNITEAKSHPANPESFDNQVEASLAIGNEASVDIQLPEITVDQTPPANRAQAVLEQVGGGRSEDVTPVEARQKGMKRLAGVGLAVGATVLGLGAANHVADNVAEASQDHKESAIELVEDYQETGEVPDGKTVIKSDTTGVAYDFSRDITSGEDTSGLQSDIHVQSNAQGDPGVQAGEIYVVDTEDITKQAAESLNPDQQ